MSAAIGDIGRGLEALRQKGAAAWPDPTTSAQLAEAMSRDMLRQQAGPDQQRLDLSACPEAVERTIDES